MELTVVEALTKRCFGSIPRLLQGKLSNLVSTCLPRPCSIAIAFLNAVLRGHPRLLLHVSTGLLYSPIHGVNAGVHDETHRAHHLHAQTPEKLLGCCVHLHLLTKPLTIQRPALQVASVQRPSRWAILVAPVLDVAQEVRKVFVFQRKCTLQVVTRYAFVQCQDRHVVFSPLFQARDIHVKAARALAVSSAGKVIRHRSLLVWDYLQRCFG
mmetsp:Transcript_7658/g.13956  ORF Transcript_7658/g.13956 Transcript_7658/m.13956 type:complete len:211 (-) Transcript_7658:731-1363(-)